MEPSSLRFYRLLLRLYPRNFREQYGPEMVQFFRLSLQEAAAENRLLGFWLATLWDVFSSSLLQHWRGANWTRVGAAGASLAVLLMFIPLMGKWLCNGSLVCLTRTQATSIYVFETPLVLLILLGVYALSRRGWLERTALGVYVLYFVVTTVGVIFAVFISRAEVNIPMQSVLGILIFGLYLSPLVVLWIMAGVQLGKTFSQNQLSLALFVLGLSTLKDFLFLSTYLLSTPQVLSTALTIFFVFKAASLFVIAVILWRSSPPLPKSTEAANGTL